MTLVSFLTIMDASFEFGVFRAHHCPPSGFEDDTLLLRCSSSHLCAAGKRCHVPRGHHMCSIGSSSSSGSGLRRVTQAFSGGRTMSLNRKVP